MHVKYVKETMPGRCSNMFETCKRHLDKVAHWDHSDDNCHSHKRKAEIPVVGGQHNLPRHAAVVHVG